MLAVDMFAEDMLAVDMGLFPLSRLFACEVAPRFSAV
jgi:ethanolamine transporter EutH